MSLQCAMYVVQDREDESLYLVGSEQGADKVALSERDIVYLNKGSNAGVKAGDLYTLHHVAYPVRHPVSGKKLGTKIETTGWVKVILVQEDTACAVIEQACLDIHAGDYLKPFEKVNVPMVVRRAPAECCEPANGKIARHVVDLQDDATIAGTGQFVTIDAGTDDGVAPGNVFAVYRILYPSVPSPRDARGRGHRGLRAGEDGDRQAHLRPQGGHDRRRGRAALGVGACTGGLGGGKPPGSLSRRNALIRSDGSSFSASDGSDNLGGLLGAPSPLPLPPGPPPVRTSFQNRRK